MRFLTTSNQITNGQAEQFPNGIMGRNVNATKQCNQLVLSAEMIVLRQNHMLHTALRIKTLA